MTFLIELRTKFRQFISRREQWANRLWRFLFATAAVLLINESIGFQKLLAHWWVALLLGGLCAFIQMRGVVVIVMFYGLLHLFSLSTDIGIASLVLLVVSYIVCGYFQAKNTYHLAAIPMCYQMQIPFIMPISEGLLGGINEMPCILFGAVVSFFLKTISLNGNAFMDPTTETDVSAFLQENLLSNGQFYIYLLAMCGVFVAVYYIRISRLRFAWELATLVGILMQFVVRISMALFMEGAEEVPAVAISSGILLALCMGLVFLMRGADYSRTEKVLYEDDDYFYYVTAVPKAHIVEQEKETIKITEGKE